MAFTYGRGAFRLDNTPQILSVNGPSDPVMVGTPVTVSVQYTALGTPDGQSVTFTWGDGEDSVVTPSQTGFAAATHAYSLPGFYPVVIRVASGTGDTAESEFDDVIVYDHSAGSAAGGGRVASPPGAFPPDLEPVAGAGGQATFGFTTSYSAGNDVPTGTTEFRAGNLDFKSTGYQWLVVAGGRAAFKGWGTIDRKGRYAFVVSALDGQAGGAHGGDRFRIRIWDASSGVVIYDNQPGADLTVPPDQGTTLEGGNLIIRAP